MVGRKVGGEGFFEEFEVGFGIRTGEVGHEMVGNFEAGFFEKKGGFLDIINRMVAVDFF